MKARVVALAHVDGAGVGVGGVDVVPVDQAAAGADGVTEQYVDDALSAGEFPPPLGVVDRSFHEAASLPITLAHVPVDLAAVKVDMTEPAKPTEIRFHVITAL